MAIKGAAATVPLSPGERIDGLNYIAELRAKAFGETSDAELARFIHAMRDPAGKHHQQNERALAALFYMAKIPTARHPGNITLLTSDEKRALIAAMNAFRAVVSLFPKRLSMPD